MQNIAIILAGGSGKRLGANTPKQFLKANDKMIIEYTIEAFQNHNAINEIAIVCHVDHISFMKEVISKKAYNKVTKVIEGGKERYHSSLNAIRAYADESVKNILDSDKPKKAVSMLVSRDTSNLSNTGVNKAAIETYGENLNDGVIAPLFYLLCFGIVGAFMYKAVNTLDSMVGYRNDKYERFGKFSARLDDVVNFIPARITAVLIAILFFSKKALFNFRKYGKKHESFNAGLPISALALAINVRLGGPTSYFGKIKNKPYFGDGKINIEDSDVLHALKLRNRLDVFIIIVLILGVL